MTDGGSFEIGANDTLERTEIVLKALAHRSRLKMILAIGAGETCVTDLQHIVGSDMSTISKHLAVLKHARIVQSRKTGLQVYYRLRIPCLVDFVACIGDVVSGRQPPVQDLLEHAARRRLDGDQ